VGAPRQGSTRALECETEGLRAGADDLFEAALPDFPKVAGVIAAIANAIHDATGKRIRNLPITLDKLL
jgi:hypothetical protein